MSEKIMFSKEFVKKNIEEAEYIEFMIAEGCPVKREYLDLKGKPMTDETSLIVPEPQPSPKMGEGDWLATDGRD